MSSLPDRGLRLIDLGVARVPGLQDFPPAKFRERSLSSCYWRETCPYIEGEVHQASRGAAALAGESTESTLNPGKATDRHGIRLAEDRAVRNRDGLCLVEFPVRRGCHDAAGKWTD